MLRCCVQGYAQLKEMLADAQDKLLGEEAKNQILLQVLQPYCLPLQMQHLPPLFLLRRNP
jgi:hypothetical protein